ncbi:hypothetical protein SAMN05660745_02627 [Corynebacterium glucuronolyticum]|nr:hypothetical protein CGLUCO_03920 [Corynebacterium glucuronolyticum DSM 44120]SMB83277.1 hypothetical protein SAMN05660745_02627 [Corynebacterium glucuronolyticum]
MHACGAPNRSKVGNGVKSVNTLQAAHHPTAIARAHLDHLEAWVTAAATSTIPIATHTVVSSHGGMSCSRRCVCGGSLIFDACATARVRKNPAKISMIPASVRSQSRSLRAGGLHAGGRCSIGIVYHL